MSLNQPKCLSCPVACECERVAWFYKAKGLFRVAWKCPRCGWQRLTVSPIGPDQLGAVTCLHCGVEGSTNASPCSACGASLAEVLAPRELAASEEDVLQLARDCFALGTCRRGLTIVNYVLRNNPRSNEALSIRTQFVEFLDAQEPFEGSAS